MNHAVRIGDICNYLEGIAPLHYQESYDNSGLLVGDRSNPVTGALISLDCTEAVVEEAVRQGCNLIVSHHPVIFGGLKRLTASDPVQRTVLLAVQKGVALYAIHTNLDNVKAGVNSMIANKLDLTNTRILAPKAGLLRKLITFVPEADATRVRQALFEAGGGHIGNYDQCSFFHPGTGSFRGNSASNPFAGKAGTYHEEKELRLELIFPAHLQSTLLKALLDSHPYETPAFDLVALSNEHNEVGAGLVGELPKTMSPETFLQHLKSAMNLQVIRHTFFTGEIKRVAVCGGAGIFLLKDALRAGVQAFVTADVKYHEFFDPDGKLLLADIGHFESEIFTADLLKDLVLKKFSTFAVLLSEINTNPINYH